MSNSNRIDYFEQERHHLEQQTIRNEKKSKLITQEYGKPTIQRMSEEEIEHEAKLRKQFSNRNYRPCASCGGSNGTPTHLALYDVKGAVKVDRYCDNCILKIG